MRMSDFQGVPNEAAAHVGPVAVDSTARLLSSIVTLDAATRFVLLRVETTALRLTVNGTTPTAALGFNYPVDSEILLTRNEADKAKVIRATGSDSAIQAAQFKN